MNWRCAYKLIAFEFQKVNHRNICIKHIVHQWRSIYFLPFNANEGKAEYSPFLFENQ